MMNTVKEKWPEILDYLKKEYDIQDITFETFILPLNVQYYKDGLVKLVFTGNSGSSGLQYIKKKYFDFLEKQFRFVPLFSPISRGSNSCNAKSDYIKKGG